MEELEGKILQRAELFLVQNGKARHIKHWKDLLTICQEKGIKPNCHSWTYKDGHEFPPKGKDIDGWPEENSNHNVGPERIMFCVPPDVDFGRIRDLGITVIQSYEVPYHVQHYLDEAHRHGLKVCNSVCGIIQEQIKEQGDWSRDDMIAQIEICKDHSAFHSWHIFEELNTSKHKVSHSAQRQVYDFFKARDLNHLITQTLSGFVKAKNGEGKDWDYVNFEALDFLLPDLYAYDGTGHCWGMEPLEALELGAKQEREYLDSKNIRKPVMFVFQVCDEPAVKAGNHDTRVPLGHIEEQFAVIEKYGLFTGGLGLWAWDHGYFGPHSSSEIWQEIKNLFDKIKRD